MATRERAASKRVHRAKRVSGKFMQFVRKDVPVQQKIEAIRRGVAAGEVEDMIEYLDVSKNDLFHVLAIPGSTGHSLIKNNRRLDLGTSERVVRVAEIARLAEASFGDHAAAARWLRSANIALGGATPLSLLDTGLGAAEVRRILSAINYGGTL